MDQTSGKDLRLSDCACRNLRMTTRVITQYYDKALLPCGLKSAQFALLNDISSRTGGVSVNELAEYAMMDQTTVTRNIDVLRKHGFVLVKTEASDARKKRITVSDAGKAKLVTARPFWKEAQLKVQQTVGQEQYSSLLETLAVLKQMDHS